MPFDKPKHTLSSTALFLHGLLASLAPIQQHRVRLLCCTLLFTQTVLALSLFTRSSMLLLPWIVAGDMERTYGEVSLTAAVFLAGCAPLASVAGVGAGVLYYARQVGKWGRFEKKMRRRPGVGRGYWMDPSDFEEGGVKGEGAVVAEQWGACWPGSALADAKGEMGERREEQLGQGEAVQRPVAAAAEWRGNRFLKHGLRSVRDTFQSGYDGRPMRRAAWHAEEMEMADRAGKL